jgi:cytochrome c peroxidase
MREVAAVVICCSLLLSGCAQQQRSDAPAAGNARLSHADEPIQAIVAVAVTDPAKVELGKRLFFEPRLSKSGFISCNSCHNLATGGVDGLPSSIGHRWKLGPINSPTVLNARYNVAQFWDGRASDLADQAGGPIANPGEMASSHNAADALLQSIPAYAAEFKTVYGTDRITIEQVRSAIAAFESTLVTPHARFDQWLEGDETALAADEMQGYRLFKEKGCVACHNGAAVGGNSFQKLGVVKPFVTANPALGRFGVTHDPKDKMVFKVPVLRNIELTAPYFHDGSRWTLTDAVGAMAEHQLGTTLTPGENDKIVAFLRTLTGAQPRIEVPILPASAAETPRPERM